jgi:hypothetical protein
VNFYSQGLHGLVGRAPMADPSTVPVPLAFQTGGHGEPWPERGGPPRRRVPAEDIIIIGRRAAQPPEQARPVRVVPRISRRRLAVRFFLVAALIGESVLVVRTWPSTPIPVPDASGPRTMIA